MMPASTAMTSTATIASIATPFWRRIARMPLLRPAGANLDLAAADAVAHLAVAAVERLAGLELDAAAAFARPHADAAVAGGRQARRAGGGLAVDPDSRAPAGAAHVAVEPQRRRSDRGGGPVGQARLASRVERLALLRREEQAAELLGLGDAGAQQDGEGEEKPLHDLAARSTIVIRSISQSARRRG